MSALDRDRIRDAAAKAGRVTGILLGKFLFMFAVFVAGLFALFHIEHGLGWVSTETGLTVGESLGVIALLFGGWYLEAIRRAIKGIPEPSLRLVVDHIEGLQSTAPASIVAPNATSVGTACKDDAPAP